MRPVALIRPVPAGPRPSLLVRLLHALAVSRSRRALTRLDDHLLRDIGLTRDEAEAEARRRDWGAPLHWRS